MKSEATPGTSESFSKEEYASALRQIEPRINKEQRLMLKAHAEAPGKVMTVFQIAAAAGSSDDNLTYSLYGRLGHMLAEALDPASNAEFESGGIWTRYIGEDHRLEPGAPVSWRMRQELAEALGEVGWAKPSQDNNPFHDVALAKAELDEAPATEREAIVLSRVGQGLFREQLLQYWTSCAVTGIAVTEALRASHIKPWTHSSNEERMDRFNGLLLIGTLDLLFDAGLISFDDAGQILISDALSKEDRKMLGLSESMKLRRLEPRHLPYLAFHRNNAFRQNEKG